MSEPRNSEPTCGPRYLAALMRYAKTPAEERLFAAGFVYGEAEKVYLGACLGAMFRPSEDTRQWLGPIVCEAAAHYGLAYRVLEIRRGYELWLIQVTAEVAFDSLADLEEDSGLWHRTRGAICGIPPSWIDERFHERRGAGQRCDGIENA